MSTAEPEEVIIGETPTDEELTYARLVQDTLRIGNQALLRCHTWSAIFLGGCVLFWDLRSANAPLRLAALLLLLVAFAVATWGIAPQMVLAEQRPLEKMQRFIEAEVWWQAWTVFLSAGALVTALGLLVVSTLVRG